MFDNTKKLKMILGAIWFELNYFHFIFSFLMKWHNIFGAGEWYIIENKFTRLEISQISMNIITFRLSELLKHFLGDTVITNSLQLHFKC